MKIEVNIEKKYAFMILGAVLVLAGVVFVVGYNDPPGSGDPMIMGHSIDEVDFNGDVDVDGSLDVSGSIGAGGNIDLAVAAGTEVDDTTIVYPRIQVEDSSGGATVYIEAQDGIYSIIGTDNNAPIVFVQNGLDEIAFEITNEPEDPIDDVDDSVVKFYVPLEDSGGSQLDLLKGLVVGGYYQTLSTTCISVWGRAENSGGNCVCPDGTTKTPLGGTTLSGFCVVN